MPIRRRWSTPRSTTTSRSQAGYSTSRSMPLPGDQGSFEISLSGPFQGVEDDPTAVPQLDLTASRQRRGRGPERRLRGWPRRHRGQRLRRVRRRDLRGRQRRLQPVQGAPRRSTGARPRRQPGEDASASFQEGCAQAIEAQGGDPAACDFDVSGWFTDLANDGTEDVEGTESVHISGNVDVAQMLDDIAGIAESVPNSAPVEQAEIDQAGEAISDASFDLVQRRRRRSPAQAGLERHPRSRPRSRARLRSRSRPWTSASRSPSARSTRTRRSKLRPTRSRSMSSWASSAASERSAAWRASTRRADLGGGCSGLEGLGGGGGGGAPTVAPARPTSTASTQPARIRRRSTSALKSCRAQPQRIRPRGPAFAPGPSSFAVGRLRGACQAAPKARHSRAGEEAP